MAFDEKRAAGAAKEMRIDILRMCHACGSEKAHLGGCMSMVELLAVLYTQVMKFDRSDWENRDRFILSKGHGGMCLYAALKQAGVLTAEEISGAMRGPDTITYRHPKMNRAKGIELSTGSLGLGLGYAVGVASALRKKGSAARVYTLIGDGECNEGSVWESAAYASAAKLNNLTAIIDLNGLQLDGATKDVLRVDNMAERWAAFGFDTALIDGHDLEAVYGAFARESDRPKAIVAKTVKGKGVSFAENVVDWHDHYLNDALYHQAMCEMGAEHDSLL